MPTISANIKSDSRNISVCVLQYLFPPPPIAISDICNFVPLPHFENTLSRGLGVVGVRLKKVLDVDAKDIVQSFLYNGMAIGHWSLDKIPR